MLEISKLKIEPGDLVVVNLPPTAPYRQVVTTRESMEKIFPENRCLVLTHNTSISTVPKAQLQAMLK